jgi:predicted DNA-binding transcriptional regulator AlpA
MRERLKTDADGNRLIYTSEICADVGVTDRCLRKWIIKGKFPPPDANLGGLNCWRLSSFLTWKDAVFAGQYALSRRPAAPTAAAA